MKIFNHNHTQVLYHGYMSHVHDGIDHRNSEVWVEDTSTSLADCFIAALAPGADLTDADLKGMKHTTTVDMTNAKCSNANFEGCDFPKAVNLTGADLSGAQLFGSTWGAIPTLFTALNVANLRGTNMPMDIPSYVNWASATYTGVITTGWSYEANPPLLP